MSEQNGTITPEQAREILNNKLQSDAQSFINGYLDLQSEHEGARLVALIITKTGPIVLEVSHVKIAGQLVEIVKR